MPENNGTRNQRGITGPGRVARGISGFLAVAIAAVVQAFLEDYPLAVRILAGVVTALIVLGVFFGIARVAAKRKS